MPSRLLLPTNSVKLLKCGTGTSYTANKYQLTTTTTPQFLQPFFQNHPGELVPEESFFWTLWCYGG